MVSRLFKKVKQDIKCFPVLYFVVSTWFYAGTPDCTVRTSGTFSCCLHLKTSDLKPCSVSKKPKSLYYVLPQNPKNGSEEPVKTQTLGTLGTIGIPNVPDVRRNFKQQ
jgi:hypothetical protein